MLCWFGPAPVAGFGRHRYSPGTLVGSWHVAAFGRLSAGCSGLGAALLMGSLLREGLITGGLLNFYFVYCV